MEVSDQREVSFGSIRGEWVGWSEVDDATRYGGMNVNVVWREEGGGVYVVSWDNHGTNS